MLVRRVLHPDLIHRAAKNPKLIQSVAGPGPGRDRAGTRHPVISCGPWRVASTPTRGSARSGAMLAVLPVTTTLAAAAVTTAAKAVTTTAAAAVTIAATPSAVTLVVIAAAGEQDGTHARNRLGSCLGQQGRGRFLAALTTASHPGRDKSGDDRGRERSPAPLRHAGEVSYLPGKGCDLAVVRTSGKSVDEVLAGRVHVNPAPVVAEVRAAAPVG